MKHYLINQKINQLTTSPFPSILNMQSRLYLYVKVHIQKWIMQGYAQLSHEWLIKRILL